MNELGYWDALSRALASLADPLREPVLVAIPVLVLFVAVEWFSARVLEAREPGGYEARDAVTSLVLGAGSQVFWLIIWDRMFGTFRTEEHRPTYGLTTPVNSRNPFRLQLHEYAAIWRDLRSARGWRERLGYALGPPGWKPRRSITAVAASH